LFFWGRALAHRILKLVAVAVEEAEAFMVAAVAVDSMVVDDTVDSADMEAVVIMVDTVVGILDMDMPRGGLALDSDSWSVILTRHTRLLLKSRTLIHLIESQSCKMQSATSDHKWTI
jgi:hypothetical protein